MREGLRGTGRRKPALADRPLQGRRYRYLHPRVPPLRGAAARGGLAMRSHLTQPVARANAETKTLLRLHGRHPKTGSK